LRIEGFEMVEGFELRVEGFEMRVEDFELKS